MSLLTTASPWNNTNTNNAKKRISTIRRPIQPTIKSEPPSTRSEPPTIEGLQNTNEYRNDRVNKLLDQITAVDSDESGLSNYEPLGPPEVQSKLDTETKPIAPMAIQLPSFVQASIDQKDKAGYRANHSAMTGPSDYQRCYNQQPATPSSVPYYAKMGLGKDDDKLMEKINYMIHLLEQQQHEKTEHITEEFLLYTFLGVFVES